MFLRNYLPDGLWAYAFLSCILIIWDRHINYIWIFAIVLTFGMFELEQMKQFVKGTGDFFDFVCYLIFGGIALVTNRYFLTKYNSKPKTKT